jgi:hypothetical protein
MKRYAIVGVALIGSLLLRPQLSSKPHAYRYQSSEQRLYEKIRDHKAAVVFLYDPSSCKSIDHSNNPSKRFKAVFTQLSTSGYYPRKAVLFMQLDVTKSAGKTIIQDNNILTHKLPAVVLFKDGVVVEDQHGIVTLSGSSSREQLKRFIDSYITIDIAQYVQEERVFKRYQDIIRDRAHVYYSPYFSKVANPWNDYWGWPYYGMAQGNYGGNIGLNFFASNY